MEKKTITCLTIITFLMISTAVIAMTEEEEKEKTSATIATLKTKPEPTLDKDQTKISSSSSRGNLGSSSYEEYFREEFLPGMGDSFREYNRSTLSNDAILKVLFPGLREGEIPPPEVAKAKFSALAEAGRPYAKLFIPRLSYEGYFREEFLPRMGDSFREYNRSTLSNDEILKVLFPGLREGEIPPPEVAKAKFLALAEAGRPYAKIFTPLPFIEVNGESIPSSAPVVDSRGGSTSVEAAIITEADLLSRSVLLDPQQLQQLVDAAKSEDPEVVKKAQEILTTTSTPTVPSSAPVEELTQEKEGLLRSLFRRFFW
ncbi:MAG: hypothetical protein K2X28_07270 [Alphaproteobacteria bacterium]|nr:hypothetical protein [Alphaproteobacteria bacterium]